MHDEPGGLRARADRGGRRREDPGRGLDPGEISRDDSFFDRGGTSLSAVKLVIALHRAVTLKDVVRTPVLTELAAVLDGASTC